MRRTTRTVVVAIPAVCLSAAILFHPLHLDAPAVPPATPGGHATVEPTLPLVLDLKVREGGPRPGEPARIEAIIDAAADLGDVSLQWVFPEGLQGEGGPAGPLAQTPLRAGERRVLEVPLTPLRARGPAPRRRLGGGGAAGLGAAAMKRVFMAGLLLAGSCAPALA